MTTKTTAPCGAKHPKKKGEVCTRDAGHVGMHSNGGNIAWKQDAKPTPLDDGKRCGVMDSKNRHACVLDQGHDGNGKGFTWVDPKKKPAKAAAPKYFVLQTLDGAVKCHDGEFRKIVNPISALDHEHCPHVFATKQRAGSQAHWLERATTIVPYFVDDSGHNAFAGEQPPSAVAPHVCGNAVRDASTGKPLKGVHARACERELGHEGVHRIGPHGEFGSVTEWNDEIAGCVSYNRKAVQPLTGKTNEEEMAQLCGATDGKNGAPCILDAGHDTQHSTGFRTWSSTAAGSVENRVYAMIVAKPGQTGPQIGRRYSKAIAKLEGEGRIEWRDEGWYPTMSKPAPMTLADEPEDPEADEAAIAAMEEGDDPLEDEVRSDAARDLARKLREDREAHAAEIEVHTLTPTQATATLRDLRGSAPTTKILGYRRHPAAALFPLLDGEAFERFADRIQASGLREPIVLVEVDGETWILDGSNRALACETRNVSARFVHYEGATDMDTLVAYSLDKNGDGRRHLDPSVRAMIAADAAKLGPGNPGDRETGRSAGLMTQAEAGKRLGVSERLVRRAVVVRDKGTSKVKEAVMKGKLAVEAAEQIAKLPDAKQDELADEALAKKSGQVKSGRVRALVRQEEKRAVIRKINTEQVAPAPVGPYRLIVADFPWPYDNSDQHEGSRGHVPYPVMPVEDGIALAPELDKLAHEDGCILAFWTTNAFMPDAVRMVEAWGFSWRSIFTWDKERDGIGTWGRGRTEHLIIAERGEVEAHTLNEVSTLLCAPRREHSRKPDEMMDLLEQHCPGPRLEMFAREPRKNWANWGAETQKFATEAA